MAPLGLVFTVCAAPRDNHWPGAERDLEAPVELRDQREDVPVEVAVDRQHREGDDGAKQLSTL